MGQRKKFLRGVGSQTPHPALHDGGYNDESSCVGTFGSDTSETRGVGVSSSTTTNVSVV